MKTEDHKTIDVAERDCFIWDLEMMVTWLREQQQSDAACSEYGDAMEHCKLALRNLEQAREKKAPKAVKLPGAGSVAAGTVITIRNDSDFPFIVR